MIPLKTFRLRLLPALGGAIVTAGLLTACSGDPTLYTLASFPGAATAGVTTSQAPAVIEVRTPSVSARLDRDTIVRANEDYKTTLAHGTSWSEALPDMVGHTLATDLAERLPGSTVFSEGDAATATAGAYVELTLRNFEADSAGHAVVTGLLSVHAAGKTPGPTVTTPIVWTSPVSVGHDTAALVAALSHGVAAISDQAAEKLKVLPQPVGP